MRKFLILLLVFVGAPLVAVAATSIFGNGAEVICGTSPTHLDDPSIEDRYTRTFLVCVPPGSEVFVGGSGVTVGSGIPVGDMDIRVCYRALLAKNAKLYCVANSSVPVRVQESR